MRGLKELITALLFCLVLGGCKDVSHFAVHGQVTLDDEPLPLATITFIPSDDNLTAAVARTDERGRYTAEVSSDINGLAPGEYTVRVSTYDEGDMETHPPLLPVKERVPSKYNYDSTMKIVVRPEPNTFDFALESKGRIE
jgi:hypothetical protein